MIKRTLIAIALLALLAASAHADLDIYSFLSNGDHSAVKVDGKETVRWPYEYKALDVCVIPIKMKVGMFVQVKDCNKKKVVLVQVDCGDIGKGGGDYPCYLGCVTFDVRANFEAKLGTSLEKTGSVIKDWSAYFDGDNVIPGDGNYHSAKVCVKAWKTQIYNAAPGDEVNVGKLHITVKPNA